MSVWSRMYSLFSSGNHANAGCENVSQAVLEAEKARAQAQAQFESRRVRNSLFM